MTQTGSSTRLLLLLDKFILPKVRLLELDLSEVYLVKSIEEEDFHQSLQEDLEKSLETLLLN